MLQKTELSKFDQYEQMTLAALMRLARDYGVKGSLFADPLSNPKVAKNAKENAVLTYPLHLAPYNLSGYQVCAMASDGCKAACLHTAGNPAYMKNKNAARIAKTKLFFEDRDLFAAILRKEVIRARKKAKALGMALAFRPNATSDIMWEKYKVTHWGIRLSFVELIHNAAPDAEIYDYTKIPGRVTPDYYTLTFSLAEDNDHRAAAELARGLNVAVVFDTKRGRELPTIYTLGGLMAKVIDGDLTDYRPDDEKGTIVGLRAKGDAIGDQSGFVRQSNQTVFFSS